MNSSNRSHLSAEPQEEDPGAYPIPFSTRGVELGSRLDSIPVSLRYWAVDKERASRHWYNEIVQANNQYEEWLCTRPPGDYPVPFKPVEGKRISEIKDSLRFWGIHPDRSSSRWYNLFVRANTRYEQHLAATREPGEFPFPRGKYRGVAIKDIPQDVIWSALRPSNNRQGWYEPLYDANKRFLDDVYKSHSPGSEPIWFGKRYRGLRLDQVHERRGFMRWCYDPQRGESGWLFRLKDLVFRLEQWRLAHPERSGHRQRRNAPNILNPVGEAIGPWDDSSGSAAEDDEYEKDSFVESDNDELEFIEDDLSDSDEKLSDQGGSDNNSTRDSNDSRSSSVETTHSVRHTKKRRPTNVILSDEESEEAGTSAGKLGKRYRVQYESSEDEEVPVGKSSKRMQ